MKELHPKTSDISVTMRGTAGVSLPTKGDVEVQETIPVSESIATKKASPIVSPDEVILDVTGSPDAGVTNILEDDEPPPEDYLESPQFSRLEPEELSVIGTNLSAKLCLEGQKRWLERLSSSPGRCTDDITAITTVIF